MAKTTIIPQRPSDDRFDIPKADKDMLSYAVAFQPSNEAAFGLWHPEYLDSAGRLNKEGKRQCRQFFGYAKNKEYMDAYRETLGGYLDAPVESGDTPIDEERKNRALQKLLNEAIKTVERGKNIDPEVLKTITEIFKKLGILKDDIDRMEAPRRYLPETCSRCRYKTFVEECIESGDIEVSKD